MLDPSPRVVLVPGVGLFGLGRSKKDARVAADLAYVQHWSLWLDMQILAKTFYAVMSGKNAD